MIRATLDGVHIAREMPDDVVLSMKLDQRCAVVALTHDPKLDDMALLEALKSDAFGMLARSVRASITANDSERLTLFDLNDDKSRNYTRTGRDFITARRHLKSPFDHG